MRVVNNDNGAEIARFDLSEDASTETAMIFGELYRHGAEWKFKAVGQGFAGGLGALANSTASTSDKYRKRNPGLRGFLYLLTHLYCSSSQREKMQLQSGQNIPLHTSTLTSGLTIRHHPVFVVNLKYACLC
jgi:hypothetical protein